MIRRYISKIGVCVAALIAAALCAPGPISLATESIDKVTDRNIKIAHQRRKMLRKGPEYSWALRAIEKLEATLKGERKVPYDEKLYPLKMRKAMLQPVVNESILRSGQPSVAIVVFDVTGAGRVVREKLIAVGPNPLWGEDALEEVADLLFEPVTEGDIGITRVGITAALYVEMEGQGRSCKVLQTHVEVAFETRICRYI